MARSANRFPAPQSAEEAEAMLLQMAGPLRKTQTARVDLSGGHARSRPASVKKPSATQIQDSISAVEKYSSAFECVADAIVIVDRDGTVALANSQLEKMFGYPRAELLGQPIELLLPERLRESHPAK